MVLHVPLEIWQQMLYYANSALPNEVTGIGTISVVSQDELEVTKIFLPHQHVSPVYSEFDEGEVNDIMTDLIATDIYQGTDLRFRWHSHGLGSVFWSNIDEADIEKWQSDWVVNLVINVKTQFLARFDLFTPFRIVNYPLEVQIDFCNNPTLGKRYFTEVKQKSKPFTRSVKF